MIDEKPVGVARQIGQGLPWRKIAIAGSVAGLGLGVLYAAADRHPHTPANIASSSATVLGVNSTAALRELEQASKDRPSGDTRNPSAEVAKEPPSTANTPAVPAPSETAALVASSSVPSPVAAKAATKTAASAKPRSAMDERLDWLERDLKEKPPQAPKHVRPDFPAIGLGAEK